VDVYGVSAKLVGKDLKGRVILRGKPAAFQLNLVDPEGHAAVVPLTGLVIRTKGPDRTRPKIRSTGHNGQYEVTFLPSKSGEFTFDVYLFENRISVETIKVHYTILPYIVPVTLAHPIYLALHTDFHYDLALITTNNKPIGIPADQLHVYVVNSDRPDEHVKFTVSAGPDHKYRIAFTPIVSGHYFINALIENHPLLEHGIPINAYGEPSGRHFIIEDVPPIVKDPNFSFSIIARDSTNVEIPSQQDFGHFHIQAIPVFGGEVKHERAETLKIHNYHSGKHIVSWTPHLSSTYHIVAKYQDQQVSSSPVKVIISKPGSGKNSIMYHEKYTIVRARVEVFANETDRKYVGGDNVKIVVKHEDGSPFDHTYSDNGDGSYTVEWRHKPGKSGKFSIASYVDGEETKDSPQFFNYAE